jgi:hypothetical protein
VADDEGSAFAFFVAPPSRRQGGIRFSSLAEAPFRGRQNLAQGGTGVLNTRRLCACWGGGTGALNMRLSRARNSRGRKSRACWSDRSPGNLSANSSKPLQGRHNLTRLQRKPSIGRRVPSSTHAPRRCHPEESASWRATRDLLFLRFFGCPTLSEGWVLLAGDLQAGSL